MQTAIAYYRTSSATNVGEDKDSEKRQRDACAQYAKHNNVKIVKEYYDAAVRGEDDLTDRPGFSNLLAYAIENNIKVILIETASRFARDMIIQLTGYEMLKKLGITIIPADCPHHFLEDTPTAKLIRAVLGAVAEFEKNALVDKLKKAKDRKRKQNGRCEGRKPAVPEAVDMARKLRAQQRSYREISSALAKAGFYVVLKHNARSGIPYKAASIRHMLLGRAA